MKIEMDKIPEFTLEDLSDKYNLTMQITERNNPQLPRYYASFKEIESKEGGMLTSLFGDGNTPDEAMANYGHKLNLKNLIQNAMGNDRKIIGVVRIKEDICKS